MAKRAGRQRTQLPNCYYEGYLEKRSFKDKTSRKLWTCLCGTTLFFFNEKRDADYIEKLDLSEMISVTDDGSQDRNLDAARLNLQMKDGNIKFTAPNAEARELWKGYIHSVAELSVPTSLNLLPGQIHMLKEAVERERERMKNLPPPAVTSSSSSTATSTSSSTSTTTSSSTSTSTSSPLLSPQGDMPACYHAVSRLEAELLLEKEAKSGNLLLRPGRDGNSLAVTTRQDHDGSVFRHYRVTPKHEGGFTIDVDNPVLCATLHDVINYLVEKTDGVLIPLIIEEPYEKSISFIRSDNENGEKSVQQAVSNLVPPSVPPKPVAPRIPTPEPAPEENLYLNYTMEEKEKETKDSSAAAAPPQVEKTGPKRAMMPPVPTPRRSTLTASPPSCAPSTNREPRMRSHTDPFGQTISELKLKLEQKAKCQD